MARRPFALLAIGLAPIVAGSVATLVPGVPVPLASAAVPAGFTQSNVASPVGPTAIEPLPDGRVVVLQQGGQVRVLDHGALVPAPALSLSVCPGGERGFLGFAADPRFAANGLVYLYYTRNAPGGCVNRVSRFSMAGSTIDPASELVLIDNLSSNNGNHNGGGVHFGPDGYLFVSVGDAGKDPRGDSGTAGGNDAAQDASLLHGKILRVDPATGEGVPGNMFVGNGGVSCRVRGNTPATPTTPCNEIYALGLRNPFRFAFDPNGTNRFFINDVGQGTREEVDLGIAGANYGWNVREGFCAQGLNPPCAPPDPSLGFTDPIADYGHTLGRDVITGGAFVPNGVWPKQFDGGYLFADSGSGEIWLRKADGTVDFSQPFATGAQGIADMAFVHEGDTWNLWYTVAGATNGSLRRIVPPLAAATAAGATAFVAQAPQRLLDTRASGGPIRGDSTRYVSTGLPSSTKAVLANIAFVGPQHDGFLTAFAGRTALPTTANVNAVAGDVVSNMSVIPLDADGGFLLYSFATTDVVVDVLGRFDSVSGPVSAGRFTPVSPTRLADTREAVSTTNQFTRLQVGDSPVVRVPVLGRGGVPSSGVSAVAMVVTGLSGSIATGGFVSATASGGPYTLTANLNLNGNGDIRPNTVVVPVGPDGAVDLRTLGVQDVVVDVAGWFTDSTAPASTSGRFVPLAPTREADTRIPLGFARFTPGSTRVLDPASVPASAAGISQNLAIVGNDAPGFLTPFPGGPVPFVAAGNVTAPGQVRSILAFTKLGAGGTESYFTPMGTDLVVDVTGWFEG
jgi:glucose/arabinose dehydrogenase